MTQVAPREPRSMAVVPEWIERHCVVPDGFRAGAPFRLYDYQLRYVAAFYLVRGDVQQSPVQPILGPAFVYRRGLLVGPQKVGKNPLIAAQVTVEGVGPALFAGWAGADDGYSCADWGCRCGWEYAYEPGEPMGMLWPTPLIQITAFSQESTENTYDALRPMIEQGPLADVIPHTGEEFIRLPGGGRIDTVTSSANSRLGARITFAPQDEVGIWTRLNKMQHVADVQFRGLGVMGGRASMTTNAWDPAEKSVAQQQYESAASDIYRQFAQPPKKLSYGNKRERHQIHLAVYPADTRRENGGHVDLDGVENEAADLVQRDLPQAMRFYGNLLVAGAGTAVNPDRWDQLAAPRDVPPKTRIGIGFDGSISQDATFMRAYTADGYGFLLGKWIRPIGAELLAWQAANPGRDWKVPRMQVHAAVAAAFATYEVGLMVCDPPKWETEVATWAALHGEETVIALETYSARRFAPAVDRWLTAIAEGALHHDGDPATAEHVKAAHLRRVHLSGDEEDGRNRYVIVKGDDHRRKIDGAVADVLAYHAAMSMPAAEPELQPFALFGGDR